MSVPMELSRILITELGDQQVIFLKEIDGERSFPIMIGTNEALAIDRRLKGIETPRPMTHDLLANTIEALGGTVESILIKDIREHTFFATILIRCDGEIVEIDSRPSDAIALGSALDTPIFVADKVINVVLNEPTTREDRIGLLRARLDMLAERIAEFSQRLADDDFLSEAPEEVIDNARHQLEEMKAEYDAIDRVLRKLG